MEIENVFRKTLLINQVILINICFTEYICLTGPLSWKVFQLWFHGKENSWGFSKDIWVLQVVLNLGYNWQLSVCVEFFLNINILKIFYLFIFRERGIEGEKHQYVATSHTPPAGDGASSPGMCSDWESN